MTRQAGWWRAVTHRLAVRLLGGPDAEVIVCDLDELYARDRARGVSAGRAWGRSGRRFLASAVSLWRERRHRAREGRSRWRDDLRSGAVLQDLRFAVRLFRKQPVPSGIAIGGLVLAIGVVTSVFTLVDRVLLRPYGIDDPAAVVLVCNAHSFGGVWPLWPYAEFLAMREQSTLSQVEASKSGQLQLTLAASEIAAPSRRVLFTSGRYLEMLGGRPAIGRVLQPADDRPGAPLVAVISHRLWSASFNADPAAVGRVVWLNGVPVTLVGVLRPEFTGPIEADRRPALWAPLATFDDVMGGQAFDADAATDVEVVARLARGVSPEAAAENLTSIANRTRAARSGNDTRPRPTSVLLPSAASPIDGPEAGEWYTAIAFFLGVTGLVLAVACANTANLLLAAASTRRSEIGLRLALGAGTRRLMRQMINESVLLALIAGAFGFLLAFWLTPLLARALSLSDAVSATPDLRVLLFTAAVAIVCGIGAGLSPARYGARGDVLAIVGDSSVTPGRTHRSRLRTSFVGFQAAVSMLLVVAAALLARGAATIASIDEGFAADQLLAVSFDPQRPGLNDLGYRDRVISLLRALPAVDRVSVTQSQPFGGSREQYRFSSDGRELGRDRSTPVAYALQVHRADAEFIPTAGLELLAGRMFTVNDIDDQAPVALVSESVVERFFGGTTPLGLPLSTIPGLPSDDVDAIVVGIVSEALLTPLRAERFGVIYRPLRPPGDNPPEVLVRAASPLAAARSIEAALRGIDPRIRPVTGVVADGVNRFLSGQRLLATLSSSLASLAVALAVLGVFGVTTFATGQRGHEVSVRLAIGASPAEVLRLLVTDSLRPVLIGLSIGLVVALALSRLVANELSGVSPHDPMAIGLAMLVMLSSAMAAVVIPARRVARANPANLLRRS